MFIDIGDRLGHGHGPVVLSPEAHCRGGLTGQRAAPERLCEAEDHAPAVKAHGSILMQPGQERACCRQKFALREPFNGEFEGGCLARPEPHEFCGGHRASIARVHQAIEKIF